MTATYVDVRMERKKQVIDIYHTEADKSQAKPITPANGKKIPSPKQCKNIGFGL